MNAPYTIRMPDLGEGITEVEVVAWHVQPGDTVKEDQALADVMTDKATVEIPSPVAGTVRELGGAVGQVLAVGAMLLRIDTAADAGAAETPTPAPSADVKAKMETDVKTKAAEVAPVADAGAALPSKAVATADTPISPAHLPLASPAVRRHARELDIDLRTVTGSGPGGRILHCDLEARVGARPAAVAAMPLATPPDTAEGHAAPLIGLRRKIAQNMEAALAIPHFTYVEEVDVTELEALRTELNERHAGQRTHLTLLPFIVRAVVLSLREHPGLNAHYDAAQGMLTTYDTVHAGIAAQTDAGLMVPVLRHADTLDIWSSAAEISRLADTARSGRARRGELSGSTISITSLGALGGIVSTPIINHPEVAIIGINRIQQKPVFHDGGIVARRIMNLSSSFDHRVVDGMQAAAFIRAIRQRLQCPGLLFTD